MDMMTIGGHRMLCTIPLSMHTETRGTTSLENEERSQETPNHYPKLLDTSE